MNRERIPFDHLFRAFIFGAVAGGASFSGQLIFLAMWDQLSATDYPTQLFAWLIGIILFFSAATPVFLIGIVMVGWPAWAMTHRMGLRSPLVGAVIGAPSASLAQWILWPIVPPYLLIFPGAAAGYVAWWMVYNRPIKPLPPPPPAPPS
ncbi:hypothetical protein [Brevundimonas sp. TSRC1-1]|uniref:hypothetical protein n=1 Tax=Brevundimonas sp. TSRC1-1 TaxID=2804562 RepID=UPI003CEF4521